MKQFLTQIQICVENYHAKFYWTGSVFCADNIRQIQFSKTKIYYNNNNMINKLYSEIHTNTYKNYFSQLKHKHMNFMDVQGL